MYIHVHETADLHRLFCGTILHLLLLTLPRGSALHTPFCILRKKAKTEMISTRLDNSNNVHPCIIEKKKRRRGWRGRGWRGRGWKGMGWRERDWRGRGWRGGVWRGGGGGGSHTTYKKSRGNKLRNIYMKAADLHHLFYGTILHLLLLTLPRGSALHTPFCILRKKAKTEMLSTRLDYSNNIYPCTFEKKWRG